jgi:hypothetical protein
MGKSCKDYVANLVDFIDGELPEELCEDIRQHIGHCNNCRIMVDSLRQTVTLCREGKKESLPPALSNRLQLLLKDRWERKFGKR